MQLIPSKISKSFLNNPNQNPTNRKDTGLIPRVTGLDDGQEEVIWFHETDPSRLELSAKDACIYNQCSVELARLEKAFIVGEKDFFQAKFLEECVESQFKSLNFSYDILYQKYELMNQEFLEIQHKKFQDQIHFIKNQINFYLNEKIEKILQELGFFHSTMILQGNYQQKLWRQEKKFHQMIQILKKLFQQTSRLQLVHFIFEKEWEEVNQIQQLIQQQLLDPLESDEKTIQARLFAYEQYQNHLLLNTGKTKFSTSTNTIKLARERLSVKYSDPITHAIYEYLQTKQEKQQKQQKQKKNVLTFDEIISQIEEIFYAKKHQKHEKHQKYQKYQKNVFFLQKSDVLVQTRKNHFLQLRKELFGDENSFVPILLPEKIDFFVKKVQQKKQKNEQIFYQLLENYQQKKRKMMFCPDFLRFDQEKQNNYLQIQTKQNK
jgi:hypothetical protein